MAKTQPTSKELGVETNKKALAKNKKDTKKANQPKRSKTKETVSELKKVSWPSFGTVVKKTGVVLTVVVIFTIVLFGFDFVLGLLYDLFTKQL